MGISIKLFTEKIHFEKKHVQLPYQHFLSAMPTLVFFLLKEQKNLWLEGRIEKVFSL